LGWVNRILDNLSAYFADRKGLLPLLGLLLVLVNGMLRVFWAGSWLSSTDLFLHLGVITAIIGFLLAWAL
jgi:hypothetical protein